MKLAVMPKQLTWWIWIAALAAMGIGLAGYDLGYVVAAAVTFAHALLFWRRTGDFGAISVQIRFAYALVLAISYLPQLRWLYWPAAAGAVAMLVFGYCAMGRTLSLLPWNRTEPISFELLRRTFFSPPVITRGMAPRACGATDGVCELESRAAYS